MLYDNALLLFVYAEAYQKTGNPSYAHTVEDLVTFLERDLGDEAGAFYSALDADSEGEEGRFYIWRRDDIEAILGADDAMLYCDYYNITDIGNFEGYNIPNLIDSDVVAFAKTRGLDPLAWQARVCVLNARLFAAREGKIHPHLDDKVLTAWNGLMIAGLAKAGRVFGKPAWIQRARQAFSFVKEHLVTPEGRLLARYRDGHAAFNAYTDDYANLIFAALELYESTFDTVYLSQAIAWQTDMLSLFWDDVADGFFLYGSDSESLIARPKEIYDGATPSGNSVAVMNLLRLADVTGDTRWRDVADRVFHAFGGRIGGHPASYCFLLMGAMRAAQPGAELVICGERDTAQLNVALCSFQSRFEPNLTILFVPEGELDEQAELEKIAPFTREQRMRDGRLTFYLCENFACQSPTHDLARVLQSLAANS